MIGTLSNKTGAVDPVLHHALDRETGRFELLQRRRADAERDQWRRQISTQYTILMLRQTAQDARARCR